MKKITKVVIPAAGFGTRFLPQTKAMPKEMLPIVDKPIVQYVVEEAVAAGIEDVILVTGWHKKSLEDHFDYPFELIQRLEKSGKEKELEEVKRIAEMANFIYVRQKGPMGNASAIYSARHMVGNEPFLVLWADDFILAQPSRTQQLIEAYEKYGSSILGTIRTNKPEDTKKYAFVDGVNVTDGVIKAKDIIEKPGPDKAPSDLAAVSGFITTPEFFEAVEKMMANNETGAGGEYVYADALRKLMNEYNQDVYAVEIKDGKYYDTGNKLEYMKTITELAMKHPEIGDDYKKYLKSLAK
jgi:UTP--glucose-1-phosphate uridylyltransferase